MQPADALESGEQFFLDTFALRQWDDPDYAGTRIEFEKAEFVAKIHEYFEKGCPLVDGYAPFCKHLFVPNFVGAKQAHVEITNANRSQLRCAYTRRRPEELGVLMRWFPADAVEVGEAKMLDIILYSRAQIEKERAALPAADPLPELPDAPWGIISVKAQDEEHETPMLPITMMRNALGRPEGGSGVPLQRDKYEEATQYWMRYATVMPADYDPEAELELEAFPDEEGLETVDEDDSAAAAADAGEGADGQLPPKMRPPAGV